MGVAAFSQEEISLCRTSHFLLLDANMRFYDQGWNERLLAHLAANSRSLICSQTKILTVNNDGDIVPDNTDKGALCRSY